MSVLKRVIFVLRSPFARIADSLDVTYDMFLFNYARCLRGSRLLYSHVPRYLYFSV
jgi:hypothetical protein